MVDVLPETLLLMDEAETHMFKKGAASELIKARAIIGLSATFGGDRGMRRVKGIFPAGQFLVNSVGMPKLEFNLARVSHRKFKYQSSKGKTKKVVGKQISTMAQQIAMAIYAGPY